MSVLCALFSLVAASPLSTLPLRPHFDLVKRDPTQDLQPNVLYQCQPGTGVVQYGMLCSDGSSICGFDGDRDSVINSFFPNGKASATLANCNDRNTGNVLYMNWKPDTLYICDQGTGVRQYVTLCADDTRYLCGFDGDKDYIISSYFPQGPSSAVPADCNNKDTGGNYHMQWQPNTLYKCEPGSGLHQYTMVCPNDGNSICGFDGERDSVINSYFPKGKDSALPALCDNKNTGDLLYMNWKPDTLYLCEAGTGLYQYMMVCPNDDTKICGFDGDRDSSINSFFPAGKNSAASADCNHKNTGDLLYMNWKPNTLYQCDSGTGLQQYAMVCPNDETKICGFDGEKDEVIASYFPGGKSSATAADCNHKNTGDTLKLNPQQNALAPAETTAKAPDQAPITSTLLEVPQTTISHTPTGGPNAPKACNQDSDCGANSYCAINDPARSGYCLSKTCSSDSDCLTGLTCVGAGNGTVGACGIADSSEDFLTSDIGMQDGRRLLMTDSDAWTDGQSPAVLRQVLMAHSLAPLANDAYKNPPTSTVGNWKALTPAKTANFQALFKWKWLSFTIYGDPDNRRYVIAFKGTEITSLNEVITDLTGSLVACNFHNTDCGQYHHGFHDAYAALGPKIRDAVQSLGLSPSSSLYITGHSLGGALASICALDLLAGQVKVDGVITFGSPRIGDSQFEAVYNTLMTQRDVLHARFAAVDGSKAHQDTVTMLAPLPVELPLIGKVGYPYSRPVSNVIIGVSTGCAAGAWDCPIRLHYMETSYIPMIQALYTYITGNA